MIRTVCVALTFLLMGVTGCDDGDGDGDGGNDENSNDEGSDSSGENQACYLDEPQFASHDDSDSVQKTWGAPCTSDAECQALIGDPDAICDDTAVIFELPGGYCTKPCSLPDSQTGAVADDPACDPNGGVHCLGALGFFERCAIACTSDEQCHREGYGCRQMPMIAQPDDPKFCLMSDCCQECCQDECASN